MLGWMGQVSALFGGRRAAPDRIVCDPVSTLSSISASTSVLATPEDAWTSHELQPPFFEWLLDLAPTSDTPLLDSERQLLARLDAVLGSESARADLLPRAPAVIPQLLSSLRDDRQSSAALAERVTKDPHLVVEVIRLANSVGAGGHAPIATLAEAIGRLGIDGLRRVIARVLLKPLFDAQADSLSARAAPRLWAHSQAQADECRRLATAAGLDAFDAYIVALMHNVGWSAALRVIDRAIDVPSGGAPKRFGAAFVHAFELRRERLFAMLIGSWQLSASISALAAEVLASVPAPDRTALGQMLIEGDRCATLQMLGLDARPTARNG